MKHIQFLEDFILNESDYSSLRAITSSVKELADLLRSKPFDSDEVDDFFAKMDTKGIKRFESYYTKVGVTNLQSLKVLNRFFKYLLDDDFLKQVKEATEDTFGKMETLLKNQNIQDPRIIEAGNQQLKSKDEILRRLDYIKRKMTRYKSEL